MLFQGGLEPFLVHVMPACGQVSGETCMDPLGNILSLQSYRNIVTISPALSMGICSQKSYRCVGAGLFLRLAILLACRLDSAAGVHAYSKVNVHFASNFDVFQALVVLYCVQYWYWEVVWSCKESEFETYYQYMWPYLYSDWLFHESLKLSAVLLLYWVSTLWVQNFPGTA